jgi:hypothetical protein
MAWQIPRTNKGVQPKQVVTIKKGDVGIPVWSLQKALDARYGIAVGADGAFGTQTETAVVSYQRAKNLTADGVVGPMTQRTLVRDIVDARDKQSPQVPTHLLYGFAEMEGGNLLAAVNDSVAGGIDCGTFQRRVYTADYGTNAVVERAFNNSYQCDLLADRLVELRSIFISRAGTNDGYGLVPAEEKAWRLACLNHNYPSAADRLSRTPIAKLDPYWTKPADWVTVHNYKFSNGLPVRTPLDWCNFYAGVLGDYSGNVTKYVKSWSV